MSEISLGVRPLPHGVKSFFHLTPLHQMSIANMPSPPSKRTLIRQSAVFIWGGRQEDAKCRQIRDYRPQWVPRNTILIILNPDRQSSDRDKYTKTGTISMTDYFFAFCTETITLKISRVITEQLKYK